MFFIMFEFIHFFLADFYLCTISLHAGYNIMNKINNIYIDVLLLFADFILASSL